MVAVRSGAGRAPSSTVNVTSTATGRTPSTELTRMWMSQQLQQTRRDFMRLEEEPHSGEGRVYARDGSGAERFVGTANSVSVDPAAPAGDRTSITNVDLVRLEELVLASGVPDYHSAPASNLSEALAAEMDRRALLDARVDEMRRRMSAALSVAPQHLRRIHDSFHQLGASAETVAHSFASAARAMQEICRREEAAHAEIVWAPSGGSLTEEELRLAITAADATRREFQGAVVPTNRRHGPPIKGKRGKTRRW